MCWCLFCRLYPWPRSHWRLWPGSDKRKINPEGEILYIYPDEGIGCGACEPECPVEAIYEQDAVPDE